MSTAARLRAEEEAARNAAKLADPNSRAAARHKKMTARKNAAAGHVAEQEQADETQSS